MKKQFHPAIPMVLVVLLLAACGKPAQLEAEQPQAEKPTATIPPSSPASPTEPPAAATDPLTGTRWTLSSYLDASRNQSAVVSGSQVTAEFSNGQVGGNAGCNSYSGTYGVDGNSLSIGQLVSTMMACEEPRMQQESAFLAALGKTASYQITDGQLSLLDAQGTVILILNADNPPASAPEIPGDQSKLLGTVWKWVETIEPSGKQVAPADPAQYPLQFNPDGGLKVKADCNLGTGGYTFNGYSLTIRVGIMTLAMCADGSLSVEFIQYLNKAGSFFFQDGALYIEEIYDGGTLKFIP